LLQRLHDDDDDDDDVICVSSDQVIAYSKL